MRLGAADIVSRLKQQGDPELELQLDVFEEEMNLDEQEIKERFEHLDVDVDDADEVYQALINKLTDTGLRYFLFFLNTLIAKLIHFFLKTFIINDDSSESFHSILRNLLLIPPDTGLMILPAFCPHRRY